MRWDPAQSGEAREGTAADAEGSLSGASRTYNIGSYHSNAWKSDNPHSGVYETEVSKTLDALNCGYPACNQGGTAVVCMATQQGGTEVRADDRAGESAGAGGDGRLDAVSGGFCPDQSEKARGNGDGETVCIITGDHENRVTDYTALLTMQGFGGYKEKVVASTCKSRDYKDATDLVVSGIDARNGAENGDLCGTLQAKPNGGFSYNCIHPVRINKSVRRLTPLECERLQGYPDGWTDIGEWIDSKGKRHDSSDSARYKALGNSIALPFWHWLMRRISAQYVGTPTLGSLFDGIGGFPLCWERINGKGTALWASEIEEFPIAVTKYHFGGDQNAEL